MSHDSNINIIIFNKKIITQIKKKSRTKQEKLFK